MHLSFCGDYLDVGGSDNVVGAGDETDIDGIVHSNLLGEAGSHLGSGEHVKPWVLDCHVFSMWLC